MLLVLPEPLALLELEPALPPAPALPAVPPEPVGTQPAGMLPSERLPLPVVESMLEPEELEPVPVVVPVEPVPEVPEPPPVCASAVPAASIAANVKATTFVIFALP